MAEFANIMHILNIFVSILATISLFCTKIYCKTEMQILPKNLRIFILYFCFTCGFLLSANCVIHSTLSLFSTNSKQKSLNLIAFPMIVLSQQLRISFFVIILDRTLATIFLQKYSNLFSYKKFFTAIISFSYIGQLPCSLPAFFGMVLSIPNSNLYFYVTWTAFIIHSLTLIMFKILHYKNQKMYKRLAYQVTLDERRQIAENIKVLTSIWPTIFLFSIIAPLGPATTLIYGLITGTQGPIALFHITYHIPTIFLFIYYKFIISKNDTEKPGIFVISPLGAVLPTHVTVENYFQNLQSQWN